MTAPRQQVSFLNSVVLQRPSSLSILGTVAASGTPVVASKTPPNIEVNNILCLNLFEPLDEKELAGLINNLWNDKDKISEQIGYNDEHIQYYA